MNSPRAITAAPVSIEAVSLDIAFSAGFCWRELDGERTARLMDFVGGTRGLHRRFIEWSGAFVTHWNRLPSGERIDYASEIELFVAATLHELIVSADAAALALQSNV